MCGKDTGGAVLLSDEIERYVEDYHLIKPFDPNNLKPASYRLTVGTRYAIGGSRKELEDKPGKNEIKIPPFEVAIISTGEKIKMPRELIGRWNLRVSKVYEGLLWIGGAQVDPGYEGYLYCPIYNLSAQDVSLRLGEPFAAIDFVRTTDFIEDKSKSYAQSRQTFDDYNWRLRSGLFTEVPRRMNRFENEIRKFGNIVYGSLGILLTFIAIIVALLSIVFGSLSKASIVFQPWVCVSLALSIIALSFSLFSYFKPTLNKSVYAWLSVLTFIVSALVVVVAALVWKVRT